VQPVDLHRTLRALEPSGWLGAARRFAVSLRTAGHEPGRLLVVGTPEHEPWHLAAHLDDTARWRAAPTLQPVLVRWRVPPGAPPHLSVGPDAVHRARTGTTVLVSAPTAAGDALLERLADARRGGATLFALHDGTGDLDDLAHDALPLPPVLGPAERLDTASHVVSTVAGEAPRRARPRWLPRTLRSTA
jgi:hypothetical protein